MRRTYKSKKEMVGSLDHRDVLVNKDEKSSAFDAFYIHNIKQTKRELSCLALCNPIGVSSTKVRKRKYVKRIVKDVEPVSSRETMSTSSAYLTPDKSIRVNKVLDPFDMLLNSSTAFEDTSKAVQKDTFQKLMPKKESKAYTRKKLRNVKKINYSSSDESGKENSSDNSKLSKTDIRVHELVVAKEAKKSPKYVDESINKIVNNLSLINNFKPKASNGCLNTSYKYGKNRLTKNVQSPIIIKSPLCSTPFKEKYRGVSIFKFSPINQNQHSPDYGSINEEKANSNTSIILVSKSMCKVPAKSQASPTNVPNQNIIESGKENSSDNSKLSKTDIRVHELVVEKEAKKSPKYVDDSINKIVNNLSLINNFKPKASNGCLNTSYKYGKNRLTKNVQSPIIIKSPLCSTPFKEKYRGVSIFKFSPINQNQHSPDYGSITEEKANSNTSIILVSKSTCKVPAKSQASPTNVPNQNITGNFHLLMNEKEATLANHENIQYSVDDIINDNTPILSNEQTSLEITEGEPFLGFPIHSAEYKANKTNCLRENNSMHSEHIKKVLDSFKSHVDHSKSTSDNGIASDHHCNTSESSVDSNGSQESMYDTCNSEQSFTIENFKSNREPIVAIERMNDSVFMRYYKKQMGYNAQELIYQMDNAQYESLSNESNEELLTNSLSTKLDCVRLTSNMIVITDSSTTEDMVTSNDDDEMDNNEEETCVSFVNTRRRNEITNDSMFLLDYTYGSSSTDCDKTVLSNVKANIEKSDNSIHFDNNSKQHQNVGIDFKDIDTEKSSEIFLSTTGSSKLPSSCISPKKIIWNSNMDGIPYSYNIKRKSTPSTPGNFNLNLKDHSSKKRQSSKTSRRSSRLSLQSDIRNSANKDIRLTSTDQTKTKAAPKNYSKSQKQRNSTSPGSDASKYERTVLDINETVIERNTNTYSNDLIDNVAKPSTTRNNSWIKENERASCVSAEVKPSIVLQPGKKWERSLSIYKRMTMVDNLDQSILEDECLQNKGRKYRQSIISTMELQECRDSLHNVSINSRRSTFISKPSRPTIRFVKDPNISKVSINTSSVFDDLKGFLNEECDDTVIELSKLSIADSEHEVTILDNFHDTERVATARDYVLRRCNQTEPILFDECYPETVLKNCHKIGEGVYGEVFLWRGRDGRARVMKIVPIAGTVKVNGEDQKDFHEIISEIVIAMELSALRAPIADIERQLDEGNDIHALDLHAIDNATDIFNEVLAVRCVFGGYPSRLLDLWELYDECKGSENDNPAALPCDQRYIVLELANAGQDLESFQFASAQQAHALFQQIAFGLAVGEEAFQFEHRDLHWGNVLISPTEQKYATFVVRGRAYRVARCGVAGTVIDYSLSRLSLPLCADSAALYNDLATDEQLFDAVGDYQFEVYRLMRDKLGNDWKNFEPYTNILWLHYIVDKMITALRYKRTNTKIHKQYIEKLKGIKNRILEYGSAVQYVLTDI